MDKKCENCLFSELDIDTEPCASCSRTRYDNKDLKWCNSIEYMAGGYEMQSAILKTQMYILRELGNLKSILDKLEPGQWDLTLTRRD